MSTSNRYSGIDDPNRWILPLALIEQAQKQPNAEWLISMDGERLTFAAAHADMQYAAAVFHGLGVRPGDRVVLIMSNSSDFVRIWLALMSMGAVSVLINIELTGAFLQHQIALAGASLIVCDAACFESVKAAAQNTLGARAILVVGGDAKLELTGASPWTWHGDRTPIHLPSPKVSDIACIMYTSGTSGPSKAVLMPHAHCALFGIGMIQASGTADSDRYYIVLPLCHANGLLMQLGATILAGIKAILRPRFSASNWLADIRTHRATVTTCLGALAAFVVAQPRSVFDQEHDLRLLLNGPNPPAIENVFRDRFGVKDVISAYGMTEINIATWGRIGRPCPGAIGWPDPRWFEVIVADPDTDVELPRGSFGEILVRPKIPFCFMAGYSGMPERTIEAWRNLWFHTGDGGTMSDDGLLTFVDRIRDCIRRRGENLSVTEIETALSNLSDVAELAIYAVASDIAGGEDEVMLAVVPAIGATLSPRVIFESAAQVLPRHMRPRFIRIVDALPKTSTGKVQRAVLKQQGTLEAIDFSSDGPVTSRQAG
jgi:crotonobetaine/carnitine-CoA ligase